MSEVHVVSRHHIKPGKFAAFERIAHAARKLAREKEPGTLAYSWYVDADRTTFVVLHRYVDIAAFMEHVANFKEVLHSLDEFCDTRIEVLGDISSEARTKLAPFGVVIYDPHLDEIP